MKIKFEIDIQPGKLEEGMFDDFIDHVEAKMINMIAYFNEEFGFDEKWTIKTSKED